MNGSSDNSTLPFLAKHPTLLNVVVAFAAIGVVLVLILLYLGAVKVGQYFKKDKCPPPTENRASKPESKPLPDES